MYLVMSGLMETLAGGVLPAALPVLAGLVIFVLLSFLTHLQQYKATYGLVYGEVKATRLRLAEPVDAVVSTLDSLNYLTRESAIRETFRRVYRWLKPGGQFIFDVNSPYKLRRMDGQMYMDETEDSFCVWRTFFSRRTQVCTYQVDLFRLNGEGTWDRDFEEHRERAWTQEQLRTYLTDAGFVNIRVSGDLTTRPPKPEEDRWIVRAEKPGNV